MSYEGNTESLTAFVYFPQPKVHVNSTNRLCSTWADLATPEPEDGVAV